MQLNDLNIPASSTTSSKKIGFLDNLVTDSRLNQVSNESAGRPLKSSLKPQSRSNSRDETGEIGGAISRTPRSSAGSTGFRRRSRSQSEPELRERLQAAKFKHVSGFAKFRVLVWKNCLIQRRHPFQTAFEFFLPFVFVSMLLVIRTVVQVERVNTDLVFRPFIPTDFNRNVISRSFIGKTFPKTVFYAPDTPKMFDLMRIIHDNFLNLKKLNGNLPTLEIKGFNTEDELEAAYSVSAGEIFGAITFEDGDLPDEIKYSVRLPSNQKFVFTLETLELPRWHTDQVYPKIQLPYPRQKTEPEGGTPGYYSQGFTFLQFAVESSIIRYNFPSLKIDSRRSKLDGVTIQMQRFPFPPFVSDGYLVALQQYLPLMIVLSFLYPVVNIAKFIVIEKEQKLMETMKMMGIGSYLHWSAWFLKNFLFLLVTVAILAFAMSLKFSDNLAVIPKSDVSIIFLFLLSYAFSTITFGFLMSTLFSKANSAIMGACMLFFLTYFPFIFLESRYEFLSYIQKISASLLSNTAMSFGCRIILGFEGIGVGINWGNIHQNPSSANDADAFNLPHCIYMILFDGVLYFLLAVYIEGVRPGEFGIPRPWYFPVQKSYWCGSRNRTCSCCSCCAFNKSKRNSNPTKKDVKNQESSHSHHRKLPAIDYLFIPQFEPPPSNLRAGIKIRGLTKKFGGKIAVDNLNLDLFENQITVMLGHNGAGKTTTMSMLTGLFPPTSGTAQINNFDIRANMDEIQGSLGLCPQKDVLFDELTCEEHLKFYCWVKGCRNVKEDVGSTLAILELGPKANTQTRSLSGGMKRKLSVGLSLIGGSQVVILDEPTAGMDPSSRRLTWDLLTSQKMNRTMILSTHFMDEADLLGDRIAVLADGQLQTVGSSLFLKKVYGQGYHLVIVIQQGCDVDVISDLLRKHLGDDVEVENNTGSELTYSLPDGQSVLFPEMFDELEARRAELKIDSYGASITTMEEVFLQVGKAAEMKKQSGVLKVSKLASATQFGGSQSNVSLTSKTADESKSQSAIKIKPVRRKKKKFNTGFALDKQQFRAFFIKKALYIFRNWIFVVIQVLIPVALVIIAFLVIKSLPRNLEVTKLKLNLENFQSTQTFVSCDPTPQPAFYYCNDFTDFVKQFELTTPVTTTYPQTAAEAMLKESKISLANANLRNIVGLQSVSNLSTNDILVGLFNNQPFHAQPVALNFLMNTLLRKWTSNQNKIMIAHNHPLPFTTLESNAQVENIQVIGLILGINFIFGLSFVVSSFVIFLIRERECKAKHLQCVSGGRMVIFWLVNFIFDFVTYLFTSLLLMIIIVSFRADPFSNRDIYLAMAGLLFLYGWATIPLMYVFSFCFAIPVNGFSKLVVVTIVSGLAEYLTVIIMELPTIGLHGTAKSLSLLFLLFPNFNLGYGIKQLSENSILHITCQPLLALQNASLFCSKARRNGTAGVIKISPCCTDYPYSLAHIHSPGIGSQFLSLFFTGIAAVLVLILIESKLIQRICATRGHREDPICLRTSEDAAEDTDVVAENIRIQTTNLFFLLKSEYLILKDLTKYFGSFNAVDGLNLGVQKGECFGLLGVNGAGKTTTFRMLTGDLRPSFGGALVIGYDILTEMNYIQKHVGYCPQFDALINELTGRETVRLFARLRGIQENEIEDLADHLGSVLLFTEYLDNRVGSYSGGNKRKLSTAVALVGDPPLIFLDEPTTGMDPVARRHLWNCIAKVRDSGTSIVLTSHSMEECEALCTRLAIMVNGRFCCLGAIQHLKSKFSEGYTVIAQIKTKMSQSKLSYQELKKRRSSATPNVLFKWEIELKPLKTFIETSFPDSVLKDVHPGYVHYHVTNPSLTWGYLFRKMEEAKRLFRLEAYSVGQTSMDQIFLMFGKGQVADE